MSISLGSLVHGRGYRREKEAERLWKWQQRWATGPGIQPESQMSQSPSSCPQEGRMSLELPQQSQHTHLSNSPGPPAAYVTLTGPNSSLSRVYINKRNLR